MALLLLLHRPHPSPIRLHTHARFLRVRQLSLQHRPPLSLRPQLPFEELAQAGRHGTSLPKSLSTMARPNLLRPRSNRYRSVRQHQPSRPLTLPLPLNPLNPLNPLKLVNPPPQPRTEFPPRPDLVLSSLRPYRPKMKPSPSIDSPRNERCGKPAPVSSVMKTVNSSVSATYSHGGKKVTRVVTSEPTPLPTLTLVKTKTKRKRRKKMKRKPIRSSQGNHQRPSSSSSDISGAVNVRITLLPVSACLNLSRSLLLG